MQPPGERLRDNARIPHNTLKKGVFIRGQPDFSSHEASLAAARRVPGRCTAAMWRNFVIRIMTLFPELAEDCLSFVIPQQQGVAAAGHGDAK